MPGKYLLVALAAAWIGWSVHQGFFTGARPGDYAYHAAAKHFADGRYQRALNEYQAALAANPQHAAALRGRAETLIALQREPEAIAIYDRLIAAQPDNAGHYANRGIAYDRLGQHERALWDYERSLALEPEIGAGPDWLTRLLRNQPQKPPGIADRAGYLREQMALPPERRLLRVPELDRAQRPYKM